MRSGNLSGALSFAFRPDSEGEYIDTDMYTGLFDGRLVKVNLETGVTEDVFNTNKDLRLQPQFQCGDYYLEHLCGRPMGMQFDNDGLRLIVLDAYKGLLSVNLEDQKYEYLSREAADQSYAKLMLQTLSCVPIGL